MTGIESAQENLAKHFGFAEFREGQEEVIRSVLDGRDAVVVMPTGSGKSLCYQLPATVTDGLTLVISPLIALMKDQVDTLGRRGLPATFVNSSLGYREVMARLAGIHAGRYKLVYVAPERFRNEAFLTTIKSARVSLLAVDEAHCISHWGHDFRPDYLKLRNAAAVLGSPPIVALTATATAQVRMDIIEQLGLRDPRVFITGFYRPNLALRVVPVSGEKDKLAVLKALISTATGSGVVYTATRKSAEQITSRLKMAGLEAEAYHGAMSDDERNRAHSRFMDGRAQTIVATNAFGMGIDKSDIRFVVHYHIPGSVEQYYQEIGRAGRDDRPAHCTLLFNYADTRTQQFFVDGSNPQADFIERVHQAAVRLAQDRVELTAQGIAALIGSKNEMAVRSALGVLEEHGIVERGRHTDAAALVSLSVPLDAALGTVPVPSIEATVLDDLVYGWSISDRQETELDLNRIGADLGFSPAHVRRALSALARLGLIKYRNAFHGRGVRLAKQEVSELVLDRVELAARASRSQSKLRKMIEYCYSKGCLWRYVLDYFGDPKRIARCGGCSSCDPKSIARLRPAHKGTEKSGVLRLKTSRDAGSANRQLAPLPVQATGDDQASDPGARSNHIAASRRPGTRGLEPNLSVGRGRSLTEPEVLVVQKVLSCVARLNDRFGKGTIARVLAGAASVEISTHALARIPTFGALRDVQFSQISHYIRALILAGCLEVNTGPYPTLRLSEFGRQVMGGRAEVLLDLNSQET
jgi:ATP-dependent DNA helicase RecQ